MPIDEQISSYSFMLVGYAVILLLGLALISIRLKHPSGLVKKILFGSIVLVTILPTLFLAGSTVYLNSISESKGPVHWHADFQIWKCGTEVELRDPKGLSNKIGTNVLHEHNDKRIHLEGVVIEKNDASLGKFFKVIGGSILSERLEVPVENGTTVLETGGCGNQPESELQFFVYKTDSEGYYTQEKLTNPASYIISPYGSVPRGDCVIVELDVYKEKTEKMCQSYEAALQAGKLKGERQ